MIEVYFCAFDLVMAVPADEKKGETTILLDSFKSKKGFPIVEGGF